MQQRLLRGGGGLGLGLLRQMLFPAEPGLQMVQRRVSGRRRQIGGQTAFLGIVAVQPLPKVQRDLAVAVLRVLGVPEDAADDVPQQRRVLGQQGFHPGFPMGSQPLQQFRV